MLLGVEKLLQSNELLTQLEHKAVGLVAHPASVDKNLKHSLDLLKNQTNLNITCGFGPQHGMLGDKQYNMEESPHYTDNIYHMPIYSLYSETRRPTEEMLSNVDVVLFDLQDVGCRIYTYVATLIYMIEACSKWGKALWVLDRPNPIGRKVEGSYLEPEWKSFVGEVELPMRHGLTLGELAKWYIKSNKVNLNLKIVAMEGYNPETPGQWGWDESLPWVNPSPQIPYLRACRPYCGTVLLEATKFSEGRGTTNPLEVVGAPEFDSKSVISHFNNNFFNWGEGCQLKTTFFVPSFNKYQGELCEAIMIHTDNGSYDYDKFKPYRLMAGLFKSIKQVLKVDNLWAQFHYEYEKERLPIDLLTGSTFFREWVDSNTSKVSDLEEFLQPEENRWLEERRPFLIY